MDGSGSTPRVAPAATARDFFHELLTSAIARQKIGIQGETELYLVNLLAGFVSCEQLGTEPLAFMLKRAIEAPREERAHHLRRMGDTALYVSGFFADSLERKLVDVDYYAAMGGRAYNALSDISRGDQRASVFSELAEKFMRIVDLFNEISERALVSTNAGLLRLYERYVRTGSTRLRGLLMDRGVFAMAPAGLVQ